MEGVPCPRIEGLTDKFSSLARLSIVNCGLTTLEGLPSLPKLNTVCGGSSLTHTHTHTHKHTHVLMYTGVHLFPAVTW